MYVPADQSGTSYSESNPPWGGSNAGFTGNAMIAIPRVGSSAIPAGHILGSKLDSMQFSPYHLLIILLLGLGRPGRRL
jgi:hypothetical protein